MSLQKKTRLFGINDEAILVSPDANLVNDGVVASSGERQLKQIDFIFSQDTDIFLLDEWDANLDTAHTQKISTIIDKLACNKCVIEVRHKMEMQLNPSRT